MWVLFWWFKWSLINHYYHQSLERLKKKRLEASKQPSTAAPIIAKSSQKRKDPPHTDVSSSEPSAKIVKRVSFAADVIEKDEDSSLKSQMPDDNDDDKRDASDDDMASEPDVVTQLPPGFFETPVEKTSSDVPVPETSSKSSSTDGDVMSQHQLPKGFFDNPVLDAKVRNVPFKNPLDDEWEKFQKEMSGESSKSDVMIQDELEEIQTLRTVEEIDQQIESWAKIDMIQKKVEQLLSHKNQDHQTIPGTDKNNDPNDSSDDDNDDDDDLDPDLLMENWRSKKTLRSWWSSSVMSRCHLQFISIQWSSRVTYDNPLRIMMISSLLLQH